LIETEKALDQPVERRSSTVQVDGDQMATREPRDALKSVESNRLCGEAAC
jgi:hypothetical protein